MLTADEIRSRTFLVALRGYDRDEVKAFLIQVADMVADLQERQSEPEPSPAESGEPGEQAVPAETAAVAGPTQAEAGESPFAELGRETQRILEAAQAAAEDIRKRAREDAEREVKSARAQATRIIADGERRREAIERVVDALTSARSDLSEDLRAVSRTIERTLRELAPEPASATVREALAAAAREDDSAAAAPAEGETGAPAEGEAQTGAPAESEAGAPAEGEAGAAAPAEGDEAGAAGEDRPAGRPGDSEADEQFLPEADVSASATTAPAHETLAAALARASRPGAGTAPAEAGGGTLAGEDNGAAPLAEPAPAAEILDLDPAGEPAPSQVRRARALGPLHPRLVRRLKRGLQDLQNATLDGLRRDAERGDVEPFLPDTAALRALSALAAEQLRLAHAAGLAAGSEVVGAKVDIEPSATALADQVGSELGGVLVTRLAEALRSGFDEGEPMSALTERVEAVFAKVKNGPAGDVAAVALVRAYEGGQKDAWAAAGVGHRRWVRGVEPPCTDPRCVDNESVGPVPLGERFPSRHDAPPVRPGCSCSTAPAEG